MFPGLPTALFTSSCMPTPATPLIPSTALQLYPLPHIPSQPLSIALGDFEHLTEQDFIFSICKMGATPTTLSPSLGRSQKEE